MKVLVLGGTKFSGLETVRKILKSDFFDVVVASRREINELDVWKIDRKSDIDLKRIFENPFDLVIDFIGFNKIDAEKLVNALKTNSQSPKILTISSTYVYHGVNSNLDSFIETDFNPLEFDELDLDWPEVSYIDGKKSCEAYLQKNYPSELLCILRFPIILGKDDPSGRTQFLLKIINDCDPTNLTSEFSGKSNYISKFDVAEAVLTIMKSFKSGIYNVAINDSVNQFELFRLLKNHFNKNEKILCSTDLAFNKTPFYYSYEFQINTGRFTNDFNLNFDWRNLLDDLKHEIL